MRVSSHPPQNIGVKKGFYRPTEIVRGGAMRRGFAYS
jgi:hypothetical protein